MPTETVAAARKPSFGQVVSCSSGKNNQAIIPIFNVFMRKIGGGQRILVLEGFQPEYWLQVERDLPEVIGRWTEFVPKLAINSELLIANYVEYKSSECQEVYKLITVTIGDITSSPVAMLAWSSAFS